MRAEPEGPPPVRFVVVSTMLRGVLEKPELLDDASQWLAFRAWREDECRAGRVQFELAYVDCELVWVKRPERQVDQNQAERVG